MLTKQEVLCGLAKDGVIITAETLSNWEKKLPEPVRYKTYGQTNGRTVLYIDSAIKVLLRYYDRQQNPPALWPIGTRVRMVNCPEAKKYGDKVWTTRSDPWEMCGSQVVLLEGYRGGFDTSCLEVVRDA